MTKRGFFVRASIATLGGAMLAGVATAALAADQVGDDDAVDVSVEVAEVTTPGVLAMTVAGTSATMAETGSTETVRQFTGALPTVTVTDTRTADEIPEGAFWYVLGSASDFVSSGLSPITPDHFGWTPDVADPEGTGAVAAGPQVDTSLDGGPNNVGLVDQELLAMALTSEEAIGSWEANADLLLRVPATTEPGTYTSQLTLSLFE